MAKKQRLTAEAKIALAQRYLKDKISQREASEIGRAGRSSIPYAPCQSLYSPPQEALIELEQRIARSIRKNEDVLSQSEEIAARTTLG